MNTTLMALDLGVGTGLISQELKNLNPMAHVTGVDFSQEMLRRAEEKQVINQSVCVDVSGTPLPLETGQFNIVFAGALFEYIKEPAGAIAELCRVTKRDGRIAFTTQASRHYMDHFLRAIGYIYNKVMGEKSSKHLSIKEYYHRSKDIIQMLEQGGMVNIQQEIFTAYRHNGPVQYYFFTARKN